MMKLYKKIFLGELKEWKLFASEISTWLFFSLIAVIALFRNLFHSLYGEYVVDKVLKQIDSSTLNKVVLLCIFIFISAYYSYWFLLKKKKNSNLLFLSFTVIMLIYIHFRSDSRYMFFGYKVFAYKLNYFDFMFFFFLLLMSSFIIGLISKYKMPHFYNSPFFIDIPLEDNRDSKQNSDRFGRTPFAIAIAEKIMCQYNHKASLAIGIVTPPKIRTV
jgi:hypothetical protein